MCRFRVRGLSPSGDGKAYDIEEQPNRRIFGKKLMRRYNGQLAQDTVYTISITRQEWRDRPLIEMEEEMRGNVGRCFTYHKK